MKTIDLSIPKGAIFSEDGKYRYAIWRVWDPRKRFLLFVGLNASTANAINDDPTIARNTKRAYLEGFGGLLGANLFALISANPEVLLKDDNPVGEHTDHYIRAMVSISSAQLCAWGSFKAVPLRAEDVYSMLPNPVCLALNSDGEPKHPLYVGYGVPLKEYRR